MGPIRTQDVTVVKQAILTQKYIMLHLLEIMIKTTTTTTTVTNKQTPTKKLEQNLSYVWTTQLTIGIWPNSHLHGVMGMSDSPFQ